MNLREATIKLAQENPELRQHLIPILRKTAEKPLEEQKFRHPDSGNMVNFKSLPADEQKRIREKSKSKGKDDEKGKGQKGGEDPKEKTERLGQELDKKFEAGTAKASDAMGAAAQKYGLFLCVQDLTCIGASFLHSASLAARIPTVAAIEGNGRQYCPAGNAGWDARYPGMFHITDGTVETGLLNGAGLY